MTLGYPRSWLPPSFRRTIGLPQECPLSLLNTARIPEGTSLSSFWLTPSDTIYLAKTGKIEVVLKEEGDLTEDEREKITPIEPIIKK